RGRTSLDGLWAAGEVASTGVHGANRLASNSLLEAVVFAARAADDIKNVLPHIVPAAVPAANEPAPAQGDAWSEPELRNLMSADVGVIRTEAGLAHALAIVARFERGADTPTRRNMATAALLVTAAAWRRRESRGAHFRSDCPASDPAKAERSFVTLAAARAVARD